jgi:hypothetical protein
VTFVLSRSFKVPIDKISRVNIFQHVTEGRTRLAADPLNIRYDPVRTDVRKNFFSKRVVADWNRISPEIKNSKNTHTFNEKYRRLLKGTVSRKSW